MRFLADMGVAGSVVRWLRQCGHDAVHLLDEGLERLPDEEIFAKAASEDRIVLTFDLDFAEIVAFSGLHRPSVLIFRLGNTTASHVLERLKVVLDESGNRLELGVVLMVEKDRYRIRAMPIEPGRPRS